MNALKSTIQKKKKRAISTGVYSLALPWPRVIDLKLLSEFGT